MIKNAYQSSNTRYSCQILIKLEFSGQTFEKKLSNIKFHKNLSKRGRDVSCGRMDRRRHDEANGRFKKFCERAYKVAGSENITWLQAEKLNNGG